MVRATHVVCNGRGVPHTSCGDARGRPFFPDRSIPNKFCDESEKGKQGVTKEQVRDVVPSATIY